MSAVGLICPLTPHTAPELPVTSRAASSYSWGCMFKSHPRNWDTSWSQRGFQIFQRLTCVVFLLNQCKLGNAFQISKKGISVPAALDSLFPQSEDVGIASGMWLSPMESTFSWWNVVPSGVKGNWSQEARILSQSDWLGPAIHLWAPWSTSVHMIGNMVFAALKYKGKNKYTKRAFDFCYTHTLYIHTQIHTCIYICICTRTCAHARTRVYTHVEPHVCICTYTHACAHTRTYPAYFRISIDTLAMAEAYWNWDEKFTNSNSCGVLAWLWRLATEDPTTSELAYGRDICHTDLRIYPERMIPPEQRALAWLPGEGFSGGGKSQFPSCQVQSWPSNKISYTSVLNAFIFQSMAL